MLPENAERLIEQLRPFVSGEEAYGRLYADFHDLMEICAWFLQLMNADDRKQLSRDDLEKLLIELDIGLIDHASFHLKSMKKEINAALDKLANDPDEDQKLHGAA
jgi:hypothetical protein